MIPDPEVSVVFQVVYDTPRGMASLRVTEYTPAVAVRGLRCQIGHRKPGESEQRSVPLSLEEAVRTEASAAILDGESLYVRLIDREGVISLLPRSMRHAGPVMPPPRRSRPYRTGLCPET